MTSETSLKYRIAAYRGNEPYAFVSYLHEDADIVFDELTKLTDAGIRISYDEGIHPGQTWRDELAKAIQNCAVFVFFVTHRSVASKNCQSELALALDYEKPVVAVHLEDVELPPGTRLAIGDKQAIVKSRFDEARYRERLVEALRAHVGVASADTLSPARNLAAAAPPSEAAFRVRWPIGAGLGLLVLAIGGYLGFTEWRADREHRVAVESAIADAEELVNTDQYGAAFTRLRTLVTDDVAKNDPRLQGLWKQIVLPGAPQVAIEGATLAYKPYDDVDGEWIVAGTTPLMQPIDLPRGVLRVRLEKPGFEANEFAVANPGPVIKSTDPDPLLKVFANSTPLVLAEKAKLPPDMVLVPPIRFPVLMTGLTVGTFGDVRSVPTFAIARFEVSNREYKEFVDAGGYDNPAYWDGLEFRDGDRLLTWDEARARFVDRTGRAGPQEWELSAFPEGKADFPVGGVSWYEAVAYSRFRQLSLPTMHHWLRTAYAPFEGGFVTAPQIAKTSNFLTDGPVKVRSEIGLGPWGTWNTAGNVREWVWNANGSERIALGGSWRDYSSIYQLFQTANPMDRLPEIGIRLMKNIDPVPNDLLAPIANRIDDSYAKREPVSNDAFEAMRFQFTAGARQPTDVKVERFADSDAWTADEVVLSFGAEEPFTIYVFLPRKIQGKLQPILYAPPGDATFNARPNRDVVEQLRTVDIVPNGGRALIVPIWVGTYQRFVPTPQDPAENYDRLRRAALRWYDDLAITIAYLGTRDDMDVDRIGLLGISSGGFLQAPMMLALDGRLKAGVLIGTGISLAKTHPMADAVNYAPRIHSPVLMINGRYDSVFPYELSQLRLFDLIGTQAPDKKQVVYDSGHFRYPRNSVAQEVTDWFDKYLGKVK